MRNTCRYPEGAISDLSLTQAATGRAGRCSSERHAAADGLQHPGLQQQQSQNKCQLQLCTHAGGSRSRNPHTTQECNSRHLDSHVQRFEKHLASSLLLQVSTYRPTCTTTQPLHSDLNSSQTPEDNKSHRLPPITRQPGECRSYMTDARTKKKSQSKPLRELLFRI